MIDKESEVFFNTDDHLWMVITDSKLPGQLIMDHPGMFMIEHDHPCRVLIDLTAYICLLHDIRSS